MEPVRDLPPGAHYIDLMSADDDDDDDDDDFELFELDKNLLEQQFDGPVQEADEYLDESRDNWVPDSPRHTAANPIDLTGFDDTSDPAVTSAPLSADNSMTVVTEGDLAAGEIVTEAACLQMVINVLPDVSIEHALSLIRKGTHDDTRTTIACERIISQLLDGGEYPKEQDVEISRKRKRNDDDDDLSDFERDAQEAGSPVYHREALELLKDVFLDVPVKHLDIVLREHKTVFKAHGIIDKQLRDYRNIRGGPFQKIGKARPKRGAEVALIGRGSALPKELLAAKKKSERESAKRLRAEKEKKAEAANLQRAKMQGEMSDCQCCFDEFPINRMTSCDGNTVHVFCKSCAKKYVEGEMGSSRCRPICFADSSCGGKFKRKELQDFLGDTSFDRLEHMQQQQDLAAAGLDFLSECPFCDFKAECLPVEVDKEFRCMNPKCRRTTCRLCDKETHVPLSCEEVKKDDQLTVRHIVEEAMSAALIRHCNKCKHAFVKEYGCNKMTCTHCRNVQCYVCSQDVNNYEHFSDGQSNGQRAARCPLHDNVEDRHEVEVKKAADEAIEKAKIENPDMSHADLMVQVSDRVKKTEEARRGQAQAQHIAFPFHIANGVLVHGPVPPPQRLAPPPPPPPAQYVNVQPFENAPFYDVFAQPQLAFPREGFIVGPMHALHIYARQEPPGRRLHYFVPAIAQPMINMLGAMHPFARQRPPSPPPAAHGMHNQHPGPVPTLAAQAAFRQNAAFHGRLAHQYANGQPFPPQQRQPHLRRY